MHLLYAPADTQEKERTTADGREVFAIRNEGGKLTLLCFVSLSPTYNNAQYCVHLNSRAAELRTKVKKQL
jgi:hypothetical protein